MDEAQAQEDQAEMRRIAIIFFTVGGTYFFYSWQKARKRKGLIAQQYDYNKTKDLVYVDKEVVRELNLTWNDLEEMASQPEKYALSNHLKR